MVLINNLNDYRTKKFNCVILESIHGGDFVLFDKNFCLNEEYFCLNIILSLIANNKNNLKEDIINKLNNVKDLNNFYIEIINFNYDNFRSPNGSTIEFSCRILTKDKNNNNYNFNNDIVFHSDLMVLHPNIISEEEIKDINDLDNYKNAREKFNFEYDRQDHIYQIDNEKDKINIVLKKFKKCVINFI